jgi:hypothetical protein
MTVNNSMEVRFVDLISQLFRLDEVERLDFGIYRIIRTHNREVCEILGQIFNKYGNNVLRRMLRELLGPHNQTARCFAIC